VRLVLALLLLLPAFTFGQQAPPPPPPPTQVIQQSATLPEAAQLKIRVFELTMENLNIRAMAVEAEARAYMATLQKPGFKLQKADNGEWAYVAEK
jgi:hypothetical protein